MSVVTKNRDRSLAVPEVCEKSSVAPRAGRVSARRPSWMSLPGARDALIEVEATIRSTEDLDASECRAEVKACLRRDIAFIGNSSFSDPEVGFEIFSDSLELAARQTELGSAAVRKSGVEMPIHLGRLCEAPLLKPLQEKQLFQRMNFLLQQAAEHRSLLNPQRPSKARLELIYLLVGLAEWHRDRIVEANLRLVMSIVKKFVNPNHTFDDLLSDGIVALIRAVEKFDYDRGFRFSTYATQVVRRNSYRAMVDKQQERQRFVSGLQEMDLDISDDQKTSIISEKRWHAMQGRLRVMLDDLDRREKLIIRARFALGSHRKVHTLQSLADRLGVSKERVRQLERRALEKLRLMAGEIPLSELDCC